MTTIAAPMSGVTVGVDTHLDIHVAAVLDGLGRLLGSAGFRLQRARKLAANVFGPPAPDRWTWRPSRREAPVTRPNVHEGSAFAALADLVS